MGAIGGWIMPKATSQVQSREKTEELLRTFLIGKGFNLLNDVRGEGEQGPAIIAEFNDILYSIDVIGAKSRGPSRSVDFKVAFCQALSRFEGSANEKSVIAMPEVFFQNGMPLKVKRFGEYAWRKIGENFPIELWFVSPQGFEQHEWDSFL